MKNVLAFVLLPILGIFILLNSSIFDQANALTCIPPPIKEEINNSDIVFLGLYSEGADEIPQDAPKTMNFEVLQMFKGIPRQSVKIENSPWPVVLPKGEYIIFAKYIDNKATLSSCTNISLPNDKIIAEIKTLNEENPEIFESNEQKFLKPKKQVKYKIPVNEIKCKDNFELIFKSSDNSPACVKPTTAEKLIERGWGMRIM